MEVQVAQEFASFPTNGQIGIVAGSSAHLCNYLYSVQIRPQFSSYPGPWNDDKYQKILLCPLRTKEHLRNFLNTVRYSPNCGITTTIFTQITGIDNNDLSRDAVFDILIQDTNLKVIFEETAGVPGGILSFLSGATPPCSALPSNTHRVFSYSL